MSDVLDRIRQELQQRLESTRAAAQEHERVRAALEALEHAVKPLEKVTRRAADKATHGGRRLATRARPAGETDRSAATTPSAAQSPSTTGRAAESRKAAAGRRTASASTAKARPAAKARSGARRSARPARARAPRGANREAVLAVVRERPGVTASELAAASGVTGGTLYALLRRLTEAGELEKRELPGGQTGYAIGAGATSAAAAGQTSEASPTDSAEAESSGTESGISLT